MRPFYTIGSPAGVFVEPDFLGLGRFEGVGSRIGVGEQNSNDMASLSLGLDLVLSD